MSPYLKLSKDARQTSELLTVFLDFTLVMVLGKEEPKKIDDVVGSGGSGGGEAGRKGGREEERVGTQHFQSWHD